MSYYRYEGNSVEQKDMQLFTLYDGRGNVLNTYCLSPGLIGVEREVEL